MALRCRPDYESSRPPASGLQPHPALEQIEAALRGLRFGHVTVIVQDGAVVQIERTEKTRLI